ncbi:uncharacterized protein BT62DRAFT_1006990 [Guyanagaster necrorhizus]|uniref:Uncharacterized protein n=1 Tax=Guyanagaster necrorhizus TaxID=856835 RepID=A0A9P7VSR4_9AGAR|nr:uncharacterized protein BT62DRAFT_1006990 [Guyanagaster necrorhizus MCA 3950]KAG7445286.1 hypothetical protein BT62DRAFT_1006990 [Guyanagaster necrorhizus MCA 3950]
MTVWTWRLTSVRNKGRALRALFIQNSYFPCHVVRLTLCNVLNDYRHAPSEATAGLLAANVHEVGVYTICRWLFSKPRVQDVIVLEDSLRVLGQRSRTILHEIRNWRRSHPRVDHDVRFEMEANSRPMTSYINANTSKCNLQATVTRHPFLRNNDSKHILT